MKKIMSTMLAMVMALLMVPVAAFAAEGEIPVDEGHFPDAILRHYIEEKADTDNNGSLSSKEILGMHTINLVNTNVADLTGIELFPELYELHCGGGRLTALDVSRNTKLLRLICSKNQLTELDLSHNPELTDLHCYGNQLTELDMSHNPKLQSVNCHHNPLQSLNLQGADGLRILICSNCQLSALDVSTNPRLELLDCKGNYLSALDVSHNPELEHLIVGRIYRGAAGDVQDRSGNQLTALDVSHNPKLGGLECDLNNLTSLNLNGNFRLESLFCEENTLLVADGVACSELPGSFDAAKVTDMRGGTIHEGKIDFAAGADRITYRYDLGNGKTAVFTLTRDPNQPVEPGRPIVSDYSNGTDIPSDPGSFDTTDGTAAMEEPAVLNDLSKVGREKKYKTDSMGNLLLDNYKAEKGTIHVSAADLETAAKSVAADKKCKGLTFKIGSATVTYDRKAVQHILDNSQGAKAVEVTLRAVLRENSGMNEAQQALAMSCPTETIFDLSLAVIDENGMAHEIHGFNGGYAVARVPFRMPEDETIEVFRIEEDGSLTKVEHFWDAKDGKMGWKTPGHSYYMVKSAETKTGAEAESGNGRMIAVIAAICTVGIATGALCVVRRRRNH